MHLDIDRTLIKNMVQALANDYLDYDLPCGLFERAINDGEVSFQEVAIWFKEAVEQYVKDNYTKTGE